MIQIKLNFDDHVVMIVLRSEGLCRLEEYLKEHMFGSIEDAFEYLLKMQRHNQGQQSSPDNSEFGSDSEMALEQEEVGSVPASEQASSVPAQGRCSEASNEEIAQNGYSLLIFFLL